MSKSSAEEEDWELSDKKEISLSNKVPLSKQLAEKIIEPFGIDHQGLKDLLIMLRTCELQKDTGYCIDINDIVTCLGKRKDNVKQVLMKLDTSFFLER